MPPVLSVNAEGRSPFVLVCDHASNRVPAPFGDLGLSSLVRLTHVAWDPGALSLALSLSERLDAPLVHSSVCRLLVDCNRAEDAPDLIPTMSERTPVPGNVGLSHEQRAERIRRFHTPFHEAIKTLLNRRQAAGIETVLVTVHSFTPIYKGVERPWPIGLLPARDETFSRRLYEALLGEDPDLVLGWNQPYSSLNGVTFTLEHHGDARGLAATMIEIRHDEILEPEGVAPWADRLAGALERAREAQAGEIAPRAVQRTEPVTMGRD